MPKTSERQRFLRELHDVLAIAILEEDDGEDLEELSLEQFLDSDLDDTAALLLLVHSNRYLTDRVRLPKTTEFLQDTFRESIFGTTFRGMARMDKASFFRVVTLIQDNPVFLNRSTCPQAPAWIQLAVTLDRFGNNGTGASLNRSRRLWGLGKGTVDDYTKRVVKALNELSAHYVRWPDAAQRRRTSRELARLGFRGCVGFIDGTTIPLAQKPAKDGECFFDRKQRYSLNAQVVCDHQRRIISFLSGWPGSCSDSTIYQEMSLSKPSKKHRFFSIGEYLLADSAYPADLFQNTIIPSYKSNMRGSDMEEFNTCVAHARVINEHTIGVLKNRWGSLKEMRTQLNTDESMTSILNWISACVVLHNMLIDFNDPWSDSEPSSSEDEGGDSFDEGVDDFDDDDPYLFRRKVKQRAIAQGRKPGGILWYRSLQHES